MAHMPHKTFYACNYIFEDYFHNYVIIFTIIPARRLFFQINLLCNIFQQN